MGCKTLKRQNQIFGTLTKTCLLFFFSISLWTYMRKIKLQQQNNISEISCRFRRVEARKRLKKMKQFWIFAAQTTTTDMIQIVDWCGICYVLSGPRKRTLYTFYQLSQLEREFSISPYVTYEKKQELCKRLNLGDAQITVWFQNRRMKLKKEQLVKEISSLQRSIIYEMARWFVMY